MRALGMAFLYFSCIFLLKLSIRFVDECHQGDWVLKPCLRCYSHDVQRTLETKDVPFRKVSDASHHCCLAA